MILYKYLPPDRIDVLRDGMIRFTQLAALNDPFDCRPQFMKPEDLSMHFDGEQCCIEWYVRSLQEVWLSTSRASVGLLCLAESFDNLLMWSHYTQDHKGFVIGFETDHPFFAQSEDGTGIYKVRYSSDRPYVPKQIFEEQLRDQPRLTPATQMFFVDDHDFKPYIDADDYRLVKSPEWEYEQEWRLLKLIRAPYYLIDTKEKLPIYLFPFPVSTIHSVIIGCRGFSRLHPELQAILAQPRYAHVKLYAMYTANSKFQLARSEKPKEKLNSLDRPVDYIPEDEEPLLPDAPHVHTSVTSTKTAEETPPSSTSDGESDEMVGSDDIFDQVIAASKDAFAKRDPLDLDLQRPENQHLRRINSAEECLKTSFKFFAKNRTEDGLRALHRAINLSSDKANGYYQASLIVNAFGCYEEAKLFLEKAVKAKPFDGKLHFFLGGLEWRLNHHWRAEACFRTVLRIDPGHAEARTDLGSIYLRQHRFAEAEECFRTAITYDVNCWQAYANLVLLLVLFDRYEDAVDQFFWTLQHPPKDHPPSMIALLHHHIALLLDKLSLDSVRKEQITANLWSRFDDIESVHCLVLMLRLGGRIEDATFFLQKAGERWQGNALTTIFMAAIHMTLGNQKDVAKLQHEVNIPVHRKNFMDRALIAALCQNWSQAMKFLKKAKIHGQLDEIYLLDPLFARIRETASFRALKSRDFPWQDFGHELAEHPG